MTRTIRTIGAVSALALLAGCAVHDHQDVYLLGGAIRHNTELQSVRDVNLPNSRAVESASGVRAAQAVKALNEGKSKELRQSSPEAEGS